MADFALSFIAQTLQNGCFAECRPPVLIPQAMDSARLQHSHGAAYSTRLVSGDSRFQPYQETRVGFVSLWTGVATSAWLLLELRDSLDVVCLKDRWPHQTKALGAGSEDSW